MKILGRFSLRVLVCECFFTFSLLFPFLFYFNSLNILLIIALFLQRKINNAGPAVKTLMFYRKTYVPWKLFTSLERRLIVSKSPSETMWNTLTSNHRGINIERKNYRRVTIAKRRSNLRKPYTMSLSNPLKINFMAYSWKERNTNFNLRSVKYSCIRKSESFSISRNHIDRNC